MRTFRWLLRAVLALLLVVSLAVTALWLRPELAQPWLEAWLSHKLQRELRVLGQFEAELGRVVEVRATKVQLANPAWASEPQLLSIARLELAFPLATLWAETFQFQRFRVEQARLAIETGPDGEPNWKMAWGDPHQPEANGAPEAPATFAPALWFQEFEIRELDILRLAQDPADVRQVRIEQLLQSHRSDDMLVLELAGAWQDRPLRYSGELGPLTALLQGTSIRVQGEGALGLLEIQGLLELDSLQTPRHPALDLELSGSDIAEVADMLGLPAPGSGAFRVRARAGLEAGLLRSQVEARVGGLELDLKGQSRELLDLTSLDYELEAHGPNLGAVATWFGVEGWPAAAFKLRGGLGRDGRRLDLRNLKLDVADTHFILDGSLQNFPNLGNSQIELRISGPEVQHFRALLGFRGIATGPFKLNVKAKSNSRGQDLLDAGFESAALRAQLRGEISAAKGLAGSELHLEAQGEDAGSILDGLGAAGFPRQPFSLVTQFTVTDAGINLNQGSSLTIGQHKLVVDGLIGRQPLAAATQLQFQVSGPQLNQIEPVRELSLPIGSQAYQFTGGFSVADARMRLHQLEGTSGPMRLQLDGLLPHAGGLNGADLSFGIAGPNLQHFLRDNWGLETPVGQQFSASGRLRASSTELAVQELRLQSGSLEGSADLVLSLPLSGSDGNFEIEARGPDLQSVVAQVGAFRPASSPFELSAKGKLLQGTIRFEQASFGLGDASLQLDGSLDLWPDLSATHLGLNLNVPELARLGRLGAKLLPKLPLRLSGGLSGAFTSLRLDSLDLTLGSSDLNGQLELSLGTGVPRITGALHSGLLNIEELGASLPAQPDKPERPTGKGRRVIPDWPLPLEELAALNAALTYSADRLQFARRAFSGVELVFALQDGALDASRFVARGVQGLTEGSGSITPLGDGSATVRSKATMTGLVLNLSRTEDVDLASLPQLSMDFDFSGRGRNLREVAATLTGGAFLRSESGVIPNSSLGILDAGLLEQLVKSIVPKGQRTTTTTLQCFEARMTAREGQLGVVPGLALVTDKVELYSRGQVDLATEGLNMGVETHPTKAYKANVGELLVNPFVRITGTLGEPKLSLDASRALVFSGTAVATAGLSIVAKGLFDRMKQSGKGDACQKLLDAGAQM